MYPYDTARTFHCPNCQATGPDHYSNCPNCGCDYLETTSGYDIGFAGDRGGYHSHDAYNDYDARNDGYPGWY